MVDDIKKYPLLVLKAINVIKNNKSSVFTVTQNKGKLMFKVVDTLPGEEFYFGIIGVATYSNSPYLQIDMRPSSTSANSSSTTSCRFEHFEGVFNNWIKLVEEYHEFHSRLDNSDFEQYQNDFFEEIKSDNGEEYLNTDAQIKFDILLEIIERKLIEINATKNNPVIQEITEEVKLLRETQGKYNKEKLADKVAWIFAKIKKAGISVLRAFWDEGKKQIIKKVIDGTFDDVGKYIDTLT